jgi:hypothetical protein
VRRREAPNKSLSTLCNESLKRGAFFMHGGESGPGLNPCSEKSSGTFFRGTAELAGQDKRMVHLSLFVLISFAC